LALQLDTLAQAAGIEAKRLDEQQAPQEKPICGGSMAKIILESGESRSLNKPSFRR
jgi:hypothetical protein